MQKSKGPFGKAFYLCGIKSHTVMKNKFLPLVALAGSLAFVGCSEDEQTPMEPGMGMIKGRVTAMLDMTSIAMDNVPQGTGITFIIDSRDLDKNPDPNFTYDKIITRATVEADGTYEVSLPVGTNPVPVQVVFDDFEFDATLLTTNDQGFQESVVARTVYKRSNQMLMLTEGQTLVSDFQYNMTNNDFVASAIMRGTLSATFRDNVGEVNGTNQIDAGTGYNTGNNIPVNGGTGSGMQVNINSVGGNGEVNFFNVTDAGTGYTIGDIVTISGGNGDATFEVTSVNTEEENVPAGVVLTFITNNGNGQEYKVATDNNGQFFVRLPVSGQDNITIRFADFETQTTYFENGNFVTGLKIYGRSPVSQSIFEDDIRELDYVMTRFN